MADELEHREVGDRVGIGVRPREVDSFLDRQLEFYAYGPHKADAVARSLTGAMTARVPGSLLQSVPGKVTWFLDADAARGLL